MNKSLSDALRSFSNGVYLIGANGKEKLNLMTAAWLTQVSSSPLMLLVSIGNSHYTRELITASRTFSVSVLTPAQLDIARKCGSISGRNADKLSDLEINRTSFGDPIVSGAAAHLTCKVVRDVNAGDHTIFIAEVIDAELNNIEVLPYKESDFL